MKLAISYFYQVRNFKKNMIPVSTAMFDPKWFHEFKGYGHKFKDRHGVLNGLRLPSLVPNQECSNLCRGRQSCVENGPNSCRFLKTYRKQLDKIDFNDLKQRIEAFCENYKAQEQLEEEPIIVFLVHETPDNPCSERVVLKDYFASKGVVCKELEYPIQ